jgi:hypothetical protein
VCGENVQLELRQVGCFEKTLMKTIGYLCGGYVGGSVAVMLAV